MNFLVTSELGLERAFDPEIHRYFSTAEVRPPGTVALVPVRQSWALTLAALPSVMRRGWAGGTHPGVMQNMSAFLGRRRRDSSALQTGEDENQEVGLVPAPSVCPCFPAEAAV